VIPLKDNIPTNRFPFVTVALILANLISYLLAIRHGGSLIGGPTAYESVKYGAIPTVLTHCLTNHEVIAGNQARAARFGEHWTLRLSGDDAEPWRLASVGGPLARR